MMCSLCWTTKLRQACQPEHQPNHKRAARIAVLGIGHELRGDDAAGLLVARQLRAVLPERDDQLILEAGPVPENQTGALRRFAPDVVILIDAALMNRDPGTIHWIDWRQITGLSASTHTLPLHVFARYVQDEFGCEVVVIGIQPTSNVMFATLSAPVQAAVQTVVAGISASLSAAGEQNLNGNTI